MIQAAIQKRVWPRPAWTRFIVPAQRRVVTHTPLVVRAMLENISAEQANAETFQYTPGDPMSLSRTARS